MKMPENQNFFKMAIYFEGSLILVAIILGWIAGINPFEDIHFSESTIGYGLMGAVILFLIFMMLYQVEINSLQQIRRVLQDTLGPILRDYHWTDLMVLAVVAGVSEEILFRGLLQPWMESSWGVTAGLIGSNIVFGLVHAVTPLYAVLAALVGIYLGLSLDFGGQRNLLTPIVIHGAYDFLAFIVVMRTYRSENN